MSAEQTPENRSEERQERPETPFHPDLAWREEITGTRPGDRVVRIGRHRYFRGVAPGTLVTRPGVMEPQGGPARVWWRLRRFLIGEPIATIQEAEERLDKKRALAVLSSDALSSVAYGTEAAMRILILAGVAALALTLPISLVIALLLIVVAASYEQIIGAYPGGGGAYVVALDNLGVTPGLTAAAALIVDYILTVTVSVAAGIAALVSAFPALAPWQVEFSVGAVVLITLLNLRGVRESGTAFAAPTYVFVFSIFGVIGVGIFRLFTGGIDYTPSAAGPLAGTEQLSLFLILSAFAKGCSAMTGTEAISNVVPVFKPPEVRNARITLGLMAGILAVMFVGISFLVTRIGIIPDPTETQTVLSQLTAAVVGRGWYYYLVQFATLLILVLAANTSFISFPRLLYVLARDRYVPRWFGLRGDRLVFSVGITVLAIFSVLLLLIFSSSVDRLLNLYALGVFTSFTLSQSGMVVHWLRLRESGWRWKVAVNGIGAVATAAVTVVIAVTKFLEGAWIVILIVPIFIVFFLLVHGHYVYVAQQLYSTRPVTPKGRAPMVLVPVSSLSRVARGALAFAEDVSKRVVAVHVAADMAEAEDLRREWTEVAGDLPLVIIESPYRLLLPPLLAYVDALRETHPDDTLVVVLPEFVPRFWWDNLLHNQTALRLKAALLYRPGVVVASYPYQLG